MTLAPFLAAPLVIKAHILAALTVAALSPLQFWGFRKGSPAHRVTGYVWLGAMFVVATSSFGIFTHFPLRLFGYGPIHLLSVLALVSIVRAVRYARAGNIIGHRKTLIGLSIGFLLAAAFTFTPPRLMWQIVAG